MITEAKKLNEIIPMRTGLNGLQEKQRKHSGVDIAIHQKYGDARRFAETFNPDLQKICAENLERSFTGNAPTIASLRSAYTERQVRVWILAQLENLNQYAGTKNKMDPNQMKMLAEIIMVEYFYFKASELLLFFHQFKAGKYGELYGSVDPLRVSSALVEFASYRRDMLFRIETKSREEQRILNSEAYETNAITIQQYRRRKLKRSKKIWSVKKSDRK
jgi:hypothetical protein